MVNSHLKRNKKIKTKAPVLWCFKDGKSGHESQVVGLINALEKKIDATVHVCLISLDVFSFFTRNIFRRKNELPWLGFPNPDLVIGAGHKTHFWMLAARLIFRCKVVVLMKPSIPKMFFDLLLVPRHDLSKSKSSDAKIFSTDGVINKFQYSSDTLPDRGLVLVGGPSKHFLWDESYVLNQIELLSRKNPRIQWEVTSSRRTPKSMLLKLKSIDESNLKFTSWADTDPDWIETRLKIASRVWVTQDSTSMIYEALSSGAEVGVICLIPINKLNRICLCTQRLIDNKIIRTDEILELDSVNRSSYLNEADRCADEITKRFFS